MTFDVPPVTALDRARKGMSDNATLVRYGMLLGSLRAGLPADDSAGAEAGSWSSHPSAGPACSAGTCCAITSASRLDANRCRTYARVEGTACPTGKV